MVWQWHSPFVINMLTRQHGVTINFDESPKWVAGDLYPCSRYFLLCCTVKYAHVIVRDHLDFSQLCWYTVLLPVFFYLHSCVLPHSPFLCYLHCFVILSGWKLLCPCDVSAADDFHLFVELYTELDVPNLLIKLQISWTVTPYAQISTLAFYLKEWCHCVDNLVISLWLLRENV